MIIVFKCPGCGKRVEGSETDLTLLLNADEEEYWAFSCECGAMMRPQHDQKWGTVLINKARADGLRDAWEERRATAMASILTLLDDGNWHQKMTGGVTSTYWRRRLDNGDVLELWPHKDEWRLTPKGEQVAGSAKYGDGVMEVVRIAAKGY